MWKKTSDEDASGADEQARETRGWGSHLRQRAPVSSGTREANLDDPEQVTLSVDAVLESRRRGRGDLASKGELQAAASSRPSPALELELHIMTAPSPPDLEALVAGPSMRSTAASIEELWQDTPLFMRELPEAIEESDAMSALQALVFEGSPNGANSLCSFFASDVPLTRPTPRRGRSELQGPGQRLLQGQAL